MLKSTFHLLCALMFFAALPARAQNPVPGTVTRIIDAKTVVVSVSVGEIKVELQYIDVPAPGDPMHDTVKAHLRDLLLGKDVVYKARQIGDDSTVAQITSKGVDISQQMLRDGAAWHLPISLSGQAKAESDAYSSLEAEAKAEKLGVWSVPNLRPPWEVRAEKKREQNSAPPRRPAINLAGGRWSKPNPAFGDMGALLNGYDPVSRTGYVGTGLFALAGDRVGGFPELIEVDVTYFYKEELKRARRGMFVVTIVVTSRKPHSTNTKMTLVGAGGSPMSLGTGKRTVSRDADLYRESLRYEISRAAMDRMVNNNYAYLLTSGHVIHLTGIRYMLYNMMQIAN